MGKNRTWLDHGMLYDFKGWLVMNGWKLEKPVGEYEVLRARHDLRDRPLIVWDRTSGGCGYSIDMRDEKIYRVYQEIREAMGKPHIHSVPDLGETYERDKREEPIVTFQCVYSFSVPLVDEGENLIGWKTLEVDEGSLWEFDLRDMDWKKALSISEIRLTKVDSVDWIQITWDSLLDHFTGVSYK